MRKFKHRVTGYIATETNSEKNYKVSEPKNFTIPKWIVEDSIDWEELIEKEYEILSFVGNSKHCCPGHVAKIKDGFIDDEFQILSVEHFLNAKCYNILSIKRLSDGEVFTIGDTISGGKIQSIICKDSNIYLEI